MVQIRPATASDAEDIAIAHAASIAGLCKKHYSAPDIEKWKAVLVPEIYSSAIEEKITLVGEDNGRILVLGILDPETAEISAIYVHPAAAHKGAGTRMLAALEDAARAAGIERISLCATLNAAGFYHHHGYTGEESAFHCLSNGTRLECIKMQKRMSLSVRRTFRRESDDR